MNLIIHSVYVEKKQYITIIRGVFQNLYVRHLFGRQSSGRAFTRFHWQALSSARGILLTFDSGLSLTKAGS